MKNDKNVKNVKNNKSAQNIKNKDNQNDKKTKVNKNAAKKDIASVLKNKRIMLIAIVVVIVIIVVGVCLLNKNKNTDDNVKNLEFKENDDEVPIESNSGENVSMPSNMNGEEMVEFEDPSVFEPQSVEKESMEMRVENNGKEEVIEKDESANNATVAAPQ